MLVPAMQHDSAITREAPSHSYPQLEPRLVAQGVVGGFEPSRTRNHAHANCVCVLCVMPVTGATKCVVIQINYKNLTKQTIVDA